MVSETSSRYRPDILERAKAADIDSLACTDWGALREIVQGLIAEVERLRSHHIQIMGKIRAWILNDCAEVCRGFDWRDEEISRQREEIDAKDARIKELEATLVDGRAEYLLLLDTNQDTVAWQLDEISEQDQDKFRRQARESLKMEEPLVMIQLREARGLIERLEAAFLESLAARLYYEHYPGVSDAYSWHDYPEDACHSMPKEEFRKKASEALEKIRNRDHIVEANELVRSGKDE